MYFDISLLNTNKEYIDRLDRLAATPELSKCCLEDYFYKIFNGFVRTYCYDMPPLRDEEDENDDLNGLWYQGLGAREEKPSDWPMPKYLRYLYEGEVFESDP